jgi:hypothetical protein
MDPSVQEFLEAREASLGWQLGLGDEDWSQPYRAAFGTVRTGDLLATRVTHDLLHMRQLVEMKYTYLAQTMEPYALKYAGEW